MHRLGDVSTVMETFVLGAAGFGILLIICALLCDRMFCEITSASGQELVLGVL